ncbi:hypothetical protein OG900_20935 [Streptomyces sp. NBC_00433]
MSLFKPPAIAGVIAASVASAVGAVYATPAAATAMEAPHATSVTLSETTASASADALALEVPEHGHPAVVTTPLCVI